MIILNKYYNKKKSLVLHFSNGINILITILVNYLLYEIFFLREDA